MVVAAVTAVARDAARAEMSMLPTPTGPPMNVETVRVSLISTRPLSPLYGVWKQFVSFTPLQV